MSEAIIMKRWNKENIVIVKPVLKTELITNNTNWVVPDHIGNISVIVYGAGGGGGHYNCNISSEFKDPNISSGGGGGYMNNGEFDLAQGVRVAITIGKGGISERLDNTLFTSGYRNIKGTSGGISSFGTYLSASGGTGGWLIPGSGGSSGGSWYSGTNNWSMAMTISSAYQFGSGGCRGLLERNSSPSAGPYGGGGGYYQQWKGYSSTHISVYSGCGGNYGGGGGIFMNVNAVMRLYDVGGGNGGNYGGGGARYLMFLSTFSNSNKPDTNGWKSIGGINGGNGGIQVWGGNHGRNDVSISCSVTAEDGINTYNWTNVFNDGNGYFRGNGKGGGYEGGGGGYGGWGGNRFGGGGGGYGSGGGNYGGGGGGYGGNGGNYGGGGGGYGKSAFGGNNGGGGGGYYGRGGNNGGGGGGYGNGGNGIGRDDGGYGAGGGGSIRDTSLGGNGGNGICIIQYYVYE